MATFPETLIAGDSYKATITSKTYTNDDGYTVVAKVLGPSGSPVPTTFNTTVTDSETFELHLTPAQTTLLSAGSYRYSIIATDGTDQYTIESGTFAVEAGIDLETRTDLRTHERKVLDAIEAVLEGRATTDQEEMEIAGRRIKRTPLRDLLKLRDYYKERVMKQENAVAGKYKLKLRLP